MVNVQKQRELSDFVNREVLLCQSILVGMLLNDGVFDWEDVENLYKSFDPKRATMPCDDCSKVCAKVDADADNCEQCYNEDPEPQEIFEWWVVSNWLADKLKEHGEPILDNACGIWWGRTCTGQSIALDGVIEAIYDEIQ